MSSGTRAYRDAIAHWLPRVATDFETRFVGSGEHFTFSDLVHYLTPIAPAIRADPYVVTVHDLIHLLFPHLFSKRTAAYYATLGKLVTRGARIVCVGDVRTVADCERFFGIGAERCRVVELGYDPAMLLSQEKEVGERPYILYAGNHRRHKNLGVLFAAWSALSSNIELDCYVTGQDDFGDSLSRYGRSSGKIVVLGNVPQERLWRLYRGATAYVHPALSEGFGLPMLEAGVLGTPVIASNESVPSMLASGATRFPATDVRSLTQAISGVVYDAAGSRRRASEVAASLRAYTWQRFAQGIAGVYREILAEK
jgi:glycosyltransferase involved in cell wall biosynthesis